MASNLHVLQEFMDEIQQMDPERPVSAPSGAPHESSSSDQDVLNRTQPALFQSIPRSSQPERRGTTHRGGLVVEELSSDGEGEGEGTYAEQNGNGGQPGGSSSGSDGNDNEEGLTEQEQLQQIHAMQVRMSQLEELRDTYRQLEALQQRSAQLQRLQEELTASASGDAPIEKFQAIAEAIASTTMADDSSDDEGPAIAGDPEPVVRRAPPVSPSALPTADADSDSDFDADESERYLQQSLVQQRRDLATLASLKQHLESLGRSFPEGGDSEDDDDESSPRSGDSGDDGTDEDDQVDGAAEEFEFHNHPEFDARQDKRTAYGEEAPAPIDEDVMEGISSELQWFSQNSQHAEFMLIMLREARMACVMNRQLRVTRQLQTMRDPMQLSGGLRGAEPERPRREPSVAARSVHEQARPPMSAVEPENPRDLAEESVEELRQRLDRLRMMQALLRQVQDSQDDDSEADSSGAEGDDAEAAVATLPDMAALLRQVRFADIDSGGVEDIDDGITMPNDLVFSDAVRQRIDAERQREELEATVNAVDAALSANGSTEAGNAALLAMARGERDEDEFALESESGSPALQRMARAAAAELGVEEGGSNPQLDASHGSSASIELIEAMKRHLGVTTD